MKNHLDSLEAIKGRQRRISRPITKHKKEYLTFLPFPNITLLQSNFFTATPSWTFNRFLSFWVQLTITDRIQKNNNKKILHTEQQELEYALTLAENRCVNLDNFSIYFLIERTNINLFQCDLPRSATLSRPYCVCLCVCVFLPSSHLCYLKCAGRAHSVWVYNVYRFSVQSFSFTFFFHSALIHFFNCFFIFSRNI